MMLGMQRISGDADSIRAWLRGNYVAQLLMEIKQCYPQLRVNPEKEHYSFKLTIQRVKTIGLRFSYLLACQQLKIWNIPFTYGENIQATNYDRLKPDNS